MNMTCMYQGVQTHKHDMMAAPNPTLRIAIIIPASEHICFVCKNCSDLSGLGQATPKCAKVERAEKSFAATTHEGYNCTENGGERRIKREIDCNRIAMINVLGVGDLELSGFAMNVRTK